MRVFDDVVQQRGAERGDVEPQVRQDVRDFQGMREIRLAGFAHLRLVLLGGKIERAAQQLEVFARAVLPHLSRARQSAPARSRSAERLCRSCKPGRRVWRDGVHRTYCRTLAGRRAMRGAAGCRVTDAGVAQKKKAAPAASPGRRETVWISELLGLGVRFSAALLLDFLHLFQQVVGLLFKRRARGGVGHVGLLAQQQALVGHGVGVVGT